VYVELLNPLDSVVTRVKIRPDEGAYYGYLLIPENVPEGDYTMRAYTAYMRNLDENLLFTKTVRIGDPQARAVHTETQFTFESGRREKVYATSRFSDVGSSAPLIPKSVKVSVNSGKMMNVKVNGDGTASINFNLPAASRKRIILLETTAYNNPYRQFIRIPAPDDDFDVSFYPEGGSLIHGAFGMIAFKAVKSNGQATNITGIVYDHTGTEIQKFETEHVGMGRFKLLAEKGKTYYAVCENSSGQSKRFDLPTAVERGYALSVSQVKERIFVTTLKPAEVAQNETLYLLAHTRGIVHFVRLWDNENNIIVVRKEQFPSGVLHLILFDAGLNPVSERLLFINNEERARVTYQHTQENFVRRSPVKNSVTLTDNEGKPLTGSFSVSVTSDREVFPDSTSNILTHLLLASDLRGHIENPAYYFQNNNTSLMALDLLMLTQGWRRYNIAELAHGRFSLPEFPVEAFPQISGTVKRVALGSPVEDIEVNLLSVQHNFVEVTRTDGNGRFYFRGIELPDSTGYIVKTEKREGLKGMNLILDRQTFPERTLFTVPSVQFDRFQFAKYADKAELKYTSENGERLIYLSELTITAEKKPLRESAYYSSNFATSITEDDLKKIPGQDILLLLSQIPGITVDHSFKFDRENRYPVYIRQSVPILMVDDVTWDLKDIDQIPVSAIEQIDVFKDANPFGMRGSGGAISIFTKRGGAVTDETSPLHIRSIIPLGYQTPIEFYAPKYDTPQKQNAQTPDLRTTIHWQPVVQTDSSGIASFEFYTADEPTSYTVVIEGLTDEGSIIRQEGKLWREE
jgi:hypothetical protein